MVEAVRSDMRDAVTLVREWFVLSTSCAARRASTRSLEFRHAPAKSCCLERLTVCERCSLERRRLASLESREKALTGRTSESLRQSGG